MEYDAVCSFHGINFGLTEGTNGLLIIKSGANGKIYGNDNKYVRIANKTRDKHNFSVIVSDNPLEMPPVESMNITMSVANQYLSNHDDSNPIYYFGTSRGAWYGGIYGYNYLWVKKWLLVNMPIFANWHKIRTGLLQTSVEQEITVIFGQKDPSYPYSELIDLLQKENIKRVTIPKADHNFSVCKEEFINLPDKFLFMR